VELTFIKGLEIVRLGPSLQSLDISWCQLLVEVCGLDRLVSLLSLTLTGNEKLLKLPSLTGLTRLHTLQIMDLEIDDVPGLDSLVGLKSLILSSCNRVQPKLPSDLTGLQCLRKLDISCLGGITEIPNLSGLEQLQVIDVCENKQLTSLQGLGDLRALTTLNLMSCKSLCRLSDMSKLTNLKVLDLTDTGVELHEEDIHMLEGLQALDPILVAYNYSLDFKRHKIMQQYWMSQDEKGVWEEKDLHYPSVFSCSDGFLDGKGFRIRDVEIIWGRMPGPATKVEGSGRHLFG
jgi:Leucine-rich repeat (LRR) protein